MSSIPDGKAELDREGIPLSDPNKAELDKDGIQLDQEKKETKKEAGPATVTEDTKTAANPQKKLIIIAVAICGAIIITGLITAILVKPKPIATEQPLPQTSQIFAPTQFSDDGEIILDPFIVNYRPMDQSKEGVLIAQISLEVNPRLAANIRGNTYEIRALILDRLSTNAHLYTKQELSTMISSDLEGMNIKKASFIRYDLRLSLIHI